MNLRDGWCFIYKELMILKLGNSFSFYMSNIVWKKVLLNIFFYFLKRRILNNKKENKETYLK